jgi:hypothetical protein
VQRVPESRNARALFARGNVGLGGWTDNTLESSRDFGIGVA